MKQINNYVASDYSSWPQHVISIDTQISFYKKLRILASTESLLKRSNFPYPELFIFSFISSYNIYTG